MAGERTSKLQKTLLEMVKNLHAEDRQVTLEEVRWLILESKHKDAALPDKLPTALETSLTRSVRKLRDQHKINVEKRVLENFDECVNYYPSKTRSTETRRMRQELLPALQAWVRLGYRGAAPKYGPGQNEAHRLRTLPDNDREILEGTWRQLELRLREVYRNSPRESDNLFLLLCKGREYFSCKDVIAHRSLRDLVDMTAADKVLSPEDMKEVEEFMDFFMPRPKARAFSFSSLIHTMASIPSKGSVCELKLDTLEYLRNTKREYVESMSGFKTVKGMWGLSFPSGNKDYDRALRRLFDHSVFRKFTFLTPVV